MELEKLRSIRDEAEQVNELYSLFCERERLTRSQAARVEFLTTVRYLDRYLRPGMRVLDLGAGAGEYSLYLAERGCHVEALELADENIRAFRERLTPDMDVTLRQGNALDLSDYGTETFDIVLLMGPLYHLHDPADRARCIQEAKRVLKPEGTMFFSFIGHDMVFISELRYNQDYFASGDFDPDAMRLHDFPFVFFTVDEARTMVREAGVSVVGEVAADGASELMAPEIDQMDAAAYERYLRYHFYRCEKPELLGFSNHLLLIGRKEGDGS